MNGNRVHKGTLLDAKTQCERPLYLKLGAELGPQVARYHQTLQEVGIVGNSVHDTVRELLTMGLASVPGDQSEVHKFDRLRIISEVRRWTLGRIFQAFKEMKQEMELHSALEAQSTEHFADEDR